LHEVGRFPDADEERLGLGVHCVVPRFERELHRFRVELRCLGTSLGDEDIQRPEPLLHIGEHALHVVDARDVGLDNEAVTAVYLGDLGRFCTNPAARLSRP
jgi:hypothetical protein